MTWEGGYTEGGDKPRWIGGRPAGRPAAPTSVSPERPSRVPRGRYCVSALQRAPPTVIGTVHTFMHTHIYTRIYVYVYIHPYVRPRRLLSGVRACPRTQRRRVARCIRTR